MILTAAAMVLTSCGALFMPYEPQQRMELASFLDFRPYTSAGFFISPDAYTGEFEPLGQLYIEIYPEEIEISESKRSNPAYRHALLVCHVCEPLRHLRHDVRLYPLSCLHIITS